MRLPEALNVDKSECKHFHSYTGAIKDARAGVRMECVDGTWHVHWPICRTNWNTYIARNKEDAVRVHRALRIYTALNMMGYSAGMYATQDIYRLSDKPGRWENVVKEFMNSERGRTTHMLHRLKHMDEPKKWKTVLAEYDEGPTGDDAN